MKILALDTSCMMGSVALVENDVVVAEELLNIKITHTERLIPSIETVLETAGYSLSDVDGLAVAIGPGSFTGLRIGLGAVKGIAFSLGKPVVGISTMKALAYNAYGSSYPVASLVDARRGEFYAGIYKFDSDNLVTLLEDTVLSPEDLMAQFEGIASEKIMLVGDGIYRLKEIFGNKLAGRFVIPPPSMIHPRASNIACLGLQRLAGGDSDNLAALSPNYIRKSDAERG